MKKVFITAVILGSLLAIYSCQEKKETRVLTKEVTFTKEATLSLKKVANDSVVAQLDIELADDGYQTETGLMYRKSMGKNQGMLFIFEEEKPRSFYMKPAIWQISAIWKEWPTSQASRNPHGRPTMALLRSACQWPR